MNPETLQIALKSLGECIERGDLWAFDSLAEQLRLACIREQVSRNHGPDAPIDPLLRRLGIPDWR